MVWNAVLFELCFSILRRPRLQYRIVVLIVRNGDIFVNVIANTLCLDIELFQFLVCLIFLGFLFVLELFHLRDQIIGVFLCLLLLAHLLLNGINVGADLRGGILGLPVVFEVGNDLVYNLDGRVPFSLRVADLLRVAAALLDEVVTVAPPY